MKILYPYFMLLILVGCGQTSGPSINEASAIGGTTTNDSSTGGSSGGSSGGTSGGSTGGGGGGPCTNCRIFITAATFDGNLGGIAGADAKCNADANKPTDGSVYKALLGDLGVRAPETGAQIDWPLRGNTNYLRMNLTTWGTSDADGHFVDGSGYTNLPAYDPAGSAAFRVWSGIKYNWILRTYNCNGWTSSSNSVLGHFAAPHYAGSSTIDSGGQMCDQLYGLYCVEQ